MGEETREPIIVGFFCHWCAYRAADLAGMARARVSASLRPVRVMCSSRVDPELVLKAFQEGADGVLIVGCHPGECHYVDGNLRALSRVVVLQDALRAAGIEPKRLEITWASASEGDLLATAVNEMTALLHRLGPLRWPPFPLRAVAPPAGNAALDPTAEATP